MSSQAEIVLQKMAPTHLFQTQRWLQDEELRSQIDCLAPPTEEENKQYWEKCWRDPTREDYAILDVNRRHIGNCGLCSIDKKRKKCELWIYIGIEQGKGFGSGGVAKLIGRAFDELVLDRIYLRVLASNALAVQFYEKLGFVQEGRWREDTILGQGRIDSLWYSMLRNEWIAKNKWDKN